MPVAPLFLYSNVGHINNPNINTMVSPIPTNTATAGHGKADDSNIIADTIDANAHLIAQRGTTPATTAGPDRNSTTGTKCPGPSTESGIPDDDGGGSDI